MFYYVYVVKNACQNSSQDIWLRPQIGIEIPKDITEKSHEWEVLTFMWT